MAPADLGHAGITPTPARPVLAFVFLALGVSIALSAGLPMAPVLALPLAMLFAVGALVGPARWRLASLAIAAVVFGFGWATLRTTHAPADFLGHRLDAAAPPIITIEGIVTTPPEIGPAQRAGALATFAPPITVTRFECSASAIITASGEAEPASGTFRVRINEPTGTVRTGDRVRITGTALAVSAPTNPGETDFRPSATQDRIAGTLLVPTAGLVEAAPDQSPSIRSIFLRARAGAQSHVRGWIERTTSDNADAGALLGALLLGERTGAAEDLHGAFARIGLSHLLSISGLHLVAVAWGALVMLRLLGDRPRLETTIVLLAVLAYCFVAPVRTPIVRAAIMVLALLASELAGRRYHPLAILALTACAIVIWKPMELASTGFQLSFGVVAALIVCVPRLEQRLFPFDPPPDERTSGQQAAQKIRRLTIAAVVAWAIATPLVACRIGVISPLAPLLTVLLAPPVTTLLTGAIGAMLVGTIVPPLNTLTAPLLALLASAVAGVAIFADALPFAVLHVPQVSALWAAGATLVIGWWMIAGDRRNKPALVGTLLMIAWTAVAFAPPSLDRDIRLRIDALDVGDGSCLLVRSGGDSILIDAGSGYFGAGLRTLPRALRALGAHRIDTAIITHANIDHYNALPDLADQIGLRSVLVPEALLAEAAARPDGPVAACIDQLHQRRVRTSAIGWRFEHWLDNIQLDVLSPPTPSLFNGANDNSIVIRFASGDQTLLLTSGDIERDAMRFLFDNHPDLHAVIAEAPHHGSAVSGSGDFLLRLDPDVVLQSTGRSRLDDPRLDEARAGRDWLVTARDSAIWAQIRSDGSVETGGVNRR